MGVITVPFDYTELTHPRIIPICIADIDAAGLPSAGSGSSTASFP